MPKNLSHLAESLIAQFEHDEENAAEETISVNPLVAKLASWYEKFRNVMEYREEEVILRAAIERILKRRLLLGGSGKQVAEPLVRELAWARYFPDNTLSESMVARVIEQIDIYLHLRQLLLAKKVLPEGTVTEWMYQLMSSAIEYTVNPKKEKEMMSNFMFHILRRMVTIIDDIEETKDAQVFLSVRRTFARDDIAFLRYHLFVQYFGDISKDVVPEIAERFKDGYNEIQKELSYPKKDAINAYVKRKSAVFLIFEDLLRVYKGSIRQLIENEDEFKKAVITACDERYSEITGKVRRAVIRSVLFLLVTKVIFAFAVEGTFETIFYGEVHYVSILINTAIPPLLMIFVGSLLRAPGQENSLLIYSYIQQILFHEQPALGNPLKVSVKEDKTGVMDAIFTGLWVATYLLSFGGIIVGLYYIGFTPISMSIFLFFLAIVSFLAYRIGSMSRVYTVEEKSGWMTPIVDFFFMPIIRVGRDLTEGIAQINILLFIFDFIIETPFKGIFGFFEQWFFFLQSKRENLG